MSALSHNQAYSDKADTCCALCQAFPSALCMAGSSSLGLGATLRHAPLSFSVNYQYHVLHNQET